jgi:16S rRNA (guanine966-N2)-methyltransferase
MRIITGSAKGLKLKAPRGLSVRPTADRVKESVFNILAGRVIEAKVADFFAGTGNLGLEALSRGATAAVFVDNSSDSINILQQNLGRAKFSGQAEVLKADVIGAIERFARLSRRFDLIFCDPPYDRGFVAAVLRPIAKYDLLEPGGLVIIEHSQRETIPLDIPMLQVMRSESYGGTNISFLKHN